MAKKFVIAGLNDKDVNWTQDDLDFQKNCYGMIQTDMVDYLNSNLRMTFKDTAQKSKDWLAFCMLSGVQELIARDRNESAMQLVNRVKFLIIQELEEVEG